MLPLFPNSECSTSNMICLYVLIVFNLFDYTARIAHRHAVGRNAAGHHTACPDDTVPADSDSRQQDGTAANPCAVLYLDGQGVCAADFLAFRPIHHHAFADFGGMGGCIYLHIGRNQHIAADVDAMVVPTSQTMPSPTSIPPTNTWSIPFPTRERSC